MTAELAVVLPVIVLMLVATLAVASAGIAHLRAADGARAAARALSLGESETESIAIARQLAGSNATVHVVHDPPWVQAVVTRPVAPVWFATGPLRAEASASARVEP